MDLKTARLRKNLTQKELSASINISEVQISNYETGKALPYPSTRKRIEDVLGPIDWPNNLEKPLTNQERDLVLYAIDVAARRLGDLEKSIKLFSNKGPDELRILASVVLGDEREGPATHGTWR